MHTINRQRLILAVVLFAMLPAGGSSCRLSRSSPWSTALLCAMIVYETISYGEGRARLRREAAA